MQPDVTDLIEHWEYHTVNVHCDSCSDTFDTCQVIDSVDVVEFTSWKNGRYQFATLKVTWRCPCGALNYSTMEDDNVDV